MDRAAGRGHPPHDQRHLVTVGLVPWSLDRPGPDVGFIPGKVAEKLDFVCVHLYPKRARSTRRSRRSGLRGRQAGGDRGDVPAEVLAGRTGAVLEESRAVASGWMSFYWGKTPEEYRQDGTIPGPHC